MKIVIEGASGKNIHLHLPSRLMLNRATAAVLPSVLEQSGISISRKQVIYLLDTIHDCRRRFPDWVLVEVNSADGEYVEVKL